MKRLIAVAVIAALAFCLCSCGYNPQVVGSIDTADGKKTEISCGRYLIAQFTATDSALFTVDSTGNTDLATLLASKVDGKDAREWIKDETDRLLKRAEAVDRIAAEYGLEFTSDERYIYEYSIGYGWSNYHNIYMANGMSYDTFYAYQMNIAMDNELTGRLYGTDGPLELDEQIVKDYRDNKTARISVIETPTTPVDTAKTLTDEELSKLDELAQQLYEEAAAKGFDAAIEKFKPLYEEILGAGCFDNAYNADQLTIEGDGRYASSMMSEVLAAKEGSYGIYSAGSHRYFIYSRNGLKDTDDIGFIRNNVCYVVGSEMYEKLIDEYTKDWKVELDQKAVKYYSVDKVTFG